MGVFDALQRSLLTFNRRGFVAVAAILLVLETVVTFFIIKKVPYTEIDWSTYVEQVECVVKRGEFNYSLIGGATGPVVYPAGHLLVYRWLYHLTSHGTDIRAAQHIFMALYLINLVAVFSIYYRVRIPPFVLALLTCTGYRIHSIFVLRLFNDPVAMLLFYLAVNCFLARNFMAGALLFSAAFSIKMNIFLFTPALGLFLIINAGLLRSVWLGVCAGFIQVFVAYPYLAFDYASYIKRSFDLGRVFLMKWTVNYRFLPEALFRDPRFHTALLVLCVSSWLLFAARVWFRQTGGTALSLRLRTALSTTPADTVFALFTANLIGITFARSLHYQFYSWYFHQLPLILFINAPSDLENVSYLSILWKVIVLLGVEYCWNTYPSTVVSSATLHVLHIIILSHAFFTDLSTTSKTQPIDETDDKSNHHHQQQQRSGSVEPPKKAAAKRTRKAD